MTNPLRDCRLWRLAVGSGLIVVAQISVMAFTVLFLHGARGLSTGAAAGMFAGMQFAGAALRIASGRWSDRVGTRIGPLVKIAFALSVTLAVSAALTDGASGAPPPRVPRRGRALAVLERPRRSRPRPSSPAVNVRGGARLSADGPRRRLGRRAAPLRPARRVDAPGASPSRSRRRCRSPERG